MSRPPKSTPNELINCLQRYASMVCGAFDSTPTRENIELLRKQLHAIEDAFVQNGKWQLECVHRDDLKAIARLVKRAAKSRGKNHGL